MKRIRLAVITVRSAAGEIGGAERLFDGLVNALNFDNVEAEEISLVSDESGFEPILSTYLRFHELDLSGFDGVISTKAPSYMVRHRNHVSYLLHTIRVFYDMFEREFPSPWSGLLDQRRFIHRIDTAALSPPGTRRIFVNGEEVRERLLQYNGLDAVVLHHPLNNERYHSGMGDEGYAFIASRLHRWKRLDLTIRAMEYVRNPMRLLIAGTGEDEPWFRKLAGSDHRIVFLGRVSDEELIELYGKARVVPFTPLREDYGLVTIEGFRCGKPVITCTDSGTPARIVQDGITGFVTPPDPVAIARALDYLYEHPAIAAEMGRKGEESIRHVRWDALRARILFELGF